MFYNNVNHPELESRKLKSQKGISLDYCLITKRVVKLRPVKFFEMTLESPRLAKVVKHDGKNWLQQVQHQISIENKLNKIVSQMLAKEC